MLNFAVIHSFMSEVKWRFNGSQREAAVVLGPFFFFSSYNENALGFESN